MCRRGIEELRNKYGAFEEALLCEAALLFRQKDSSAAVDVVQKYRKEKGDSCSTSVHFALAQIYLNEGGTKIWNYIYFFKSFFLISFLKGN